MTEALMVALVLVATSLFVAAVCWPLATDRIGRNLFYGFRTPRTVNDDTAWRIVNQHAGWGGFYGGLLAAVVIPMAFPLGVPVMTGVMLATLLGGMMVGTALGCEALAQSDTQPALLPETPRLDEAAAVRQRQPVRVSER